MAPTDAAVWLEIASALFALGLISVLFASVSMRFFTEYGNETQENLNSSPAQQRAPRGQQVAAERLVIACLLAMSSAIAFFADARRRLWLFSETPDWPTGFRVAVVFRYSLPLILRNLRLTARLTLKSHTP